MNDTDSKDINLETQVLLEGDKVFHHLLLGGAGGDVQPQREVSLAAFSSQLACVYANHATLDIGLVPHRMAIRDVHQERGMLVFLVEVEPGIRTLKWLKDDSPAAYGDTATYGEVTISLPYVYFFVSMTLVGIVGYANSVYFRNTPLTTIDDPLLDCAFFNCSIDAPNHNEHCWICTQGVSFRLKRGGSRAALVDTFIQWFWSSGFNLSSEFNEGESCWGRTRECIGDERLKSIAAWEKATAADPDFACSVAWLDAQRTAPQVYKELVSYNTPWRPGTSAEYAKLVAAAHKAERKEAQGGEE